MTAKKNDVNALNEFGYCIKSKDWTVQWQNRQCQSICGDKKGTRCEKNCEAWSREKGFEFQEGAQVFHKKVLTNDGNHFDVVVCQNQNEVLSILCPVEKASQIQKEKYLQAGLSRRELEVAILREEGLSRKEICERLFISLSTLKSHLQRIRDKMQAAFTGQRGP